MIYAPAVLALLHAVDVHAVAHITGGGLPGQPPPGPARRRRRRSWTGAAGSVPPIFGEIQRAGRVSDDEMARVFNLGLGMVIAVAPDSVASAIEAVGPLGHAAVVVGTVAEGAGPLEWRS